MWDFVAHFDDGGYRVVTSLIPSFEDRRHVMSHFSAPGLCLAVRR
jgi:hypothetical protein